MKQLQPHPQIQHKQRLTSSTSSGLNKLSERKKNTRRCFLKQTALATVGAPALMQSVTAAEILSPVAFESAFASNKGKPEPVGKINHRKAEAARIEERHLRLWNVQTDEYYEGPYWASGRFLTPAIEQISYLLRDFRREEAWPIDPYVIDFMYAVYSQLDTREPLHILSGYRSAQTNAELAKTYERVASNSLHITGKAIDFRLPSVKARKLRNLAIEANRGGVGYYAARDFIHIDTGPVRAWQ